MATLRERKGLNRVSYEVRIRHLGHPAITRTFRRKTDARRWAAEQETLLLKGQAVETSEARRRSLGAAIDRYLDLHVGGEGVGLGERKSGALGGEAEGA